MKSQKTQNPTTRTQATQKTVRSPKAKNEPKPQPNPQRAKRTTKPKSDTLQIISNAAKTPQYTPADVKRLMDRLDLNEKAFALVMNVSPMTVRYWTAGAVKPCGLSRRLMQLFDASPAAAAKIVAGQEV